VAILGSGSDYTVFFNHLGVPSLDMLFDGPYGVYHSSYDSHEWMRRFGDPSFEYHAAMARLWGLMALRLANADLPPFDYAAYGRDILAYLAELTPLAREHRVPLDLEAAREAAFALSRVGLPQVPAEPARARSAAAGLLRAERELLARDGIPGRPWFRHLVYAPLPSYEAETLPGVREAVLAGDVDRAQAQVFVLAAALQRAVRALAPAR
jgi:N-acetylated-alpha-linked acidic dipeptidase